MKLIGVSAPSGSGKSTFAKYLAENLPNSRIIDLDNVMLNNMQNKHNLILQLYGEKAIREDGTYDIGYLIKYPQKMKKAKVLYYDENIRKSSFIEMFPNIDNQYIIIEHYYLNETKIWDDCDLKIAIDTDLNQRINAIKRRNINHVHTEEQLNLRANYGNIRKNYCDIEVFNNYDGKSLKKHAQFIANTLINSDLKHLSFAFPGRIQMCPLNFSAFDFSKESLVGGGGYGAAIEIDNKFHAHYLIGKEDTIICNKEDKKVLIKHLLNIIRNSRNSNKNLSLYVDISIDTSFDSHSGIGSNASLTSACICGFNKLLGNKTKEELIETIKCNYYETDNGELIKGLTTGVSFHSFFEGGFVIVGNDGNLIFNKKLENSMKAYLINPEIRRDIQDIEDINQLEASRNLDKNYKFERAYDLLMEVIPSINKNDYSKLAEYNYKNHLNGGQTAVIESYPNKGKEIKRILSLLKNPKFIIGVSSCGPYMYLFTQYYREAEKILDSNDINYRKINIKNSSTYNEIYDIKS